MDFGAYVDRRKKRYMAQMLEEFEDSVQPHVSTGVAEAFKAFVRRKLNSFANDVSDAGDLESQVRNGVAQGMEDRLFPDGRRKR